VAAVDLGKQVGPLPLGAWVAVVGAGLGVALYTRRTTGASTATDSTNADGTVDDTSGVAGVGDGSVGGWVGTSPAPSVAGDAVTAPTDNAEWGRRATNLLISDGYDAAVAQSAITKALSGGEAGAMSASEWTLWRIALVKLGAPPEPVSVAEPSTAPGPVDSGIPVDSPVATSATRIVYRDTTTARERRNRWLANHPAYNVALKKGGATLRKFRREHPALAKEWDALQ
jgi:hypothetical protein